MGPKQPPMGPARTKRAARAYHQDVTPASTGWNDVIARPPPVAPTAPRAPAAPAAVPRAAAGAPPASQLAPPAAAEEDDPLDHMPVHRNVISPTQLAANRAAMQNMGMPVPSAPQAGVPAGSGVSMGAMAPGAAPGGAPRPKINPD